MSGKKKLAVLSATVMTALVLGSGVTLAADAGAQEDYFSSDESFEAFRAAFAEVFGEEPAAISETDSDLDAGIADLVTADTGDTDTGDTGTGDTGTGDTGTGDTDSGDTDGDTETEDTDSEKATISGSDTVKIENGVVSVKTEGKITKGNAGIVTGGDVYDAIDARVSEMGNRINSLDGKVNRVGAGAAALAALHPEAFTPGDKWSFAVGLGHYENANAGAIGAFFKPNADTTVSLGSTIGNGTSMINAGVSFKLGSRGAFTAGTLDQRDFLALRAENEAQTKEINAQRQELNSQRQEINVLRNQLLQLVQALRKRQQ